MNAGRPQLAGTFGAVSSTHWLPSAAAMSVLEQGGNAFDAVAAAGFVLQVVEPHYNGLGGDVPIVSYQASTGRVQVVCGQGPTPQAATTEAITKLGLDQIPGSGLLPAVVPGAFGAWMRLLAEHGTLPLDRILDHAIGYAEHGFPLLTSTADAIEVLAPLFASEWTESARVYLPNGRPPAAGSRFRNPALAGTYQRLLREAKAAGGDREAQIAAAERAFYQGFVAEAVDAFVPRTEVLDSTGRRHKGLLTGQDMADWRATVEDSVSLTYRGYEVHKPGIWSQSPVFLQQLALLEGFDLGRMDLDSAEYVHTVAECAKLAFADREAWYGDPDHSDIPLTTLLSPAYTAERRALLEAKAAGTLRPGSPDGRTPHIPAQVAQEPTEALEHWERQIRNGLPTVVKATAARNDTCTVVVADRFGNMVAAVPSGGWLKSSPVVPGTGISLGTRAQTMTLEPGHPNSFGPGRRPRTTLSPSLVLKDGRPVLAFGTPGGDRQDQWTLGFFLAVADFGHDLQTATETLAFHTDHFASSFTPHESRPKTLVVEETVDPEVVEQLRTRGHEVELAPAYTLGKVCAVGHDPDQDLLLAAASPRGRQTYAIAR
ncbi:gamma-glutamyltransferase family protein [Streptomyces lichenis]|uniref:Gamma-glutamyltransferase family protein n=1 Tax=Streptomyces lichenis TaxID=2306967 RepID=A0ABT0I8A2_9ACTN|nr:gamma-glutamyltransferase family protein [Streptomyces lichenis]MCK8677557.1 gamma-glutamyltransferase family protein [Streptomyces lichenis]